MAITNASRLSNFGSGIGTQGAILTVDNDNKRIGVGTTNPSTKFQVGEKVQIDGNNIYAPIGVITATTVEATSFNGDGSGLTGVASTDYIITGTAATFNNKVNVGTAITIEPGAGAGLNVTGVATFSGSVTAGSVTADSFSGDGSNLTGISGFATALSSTATSPLFKVFKTPRILEVGAATSITVASDNTSGDIAFCREALIHVGAAATFHIGSGTTLMTNVLSIF